MTRADKERRVRDHVRSVAAELPAVLHKVEGALSDRQKPLMMYVRDMGGLLSDFAEGRDVNARQLNAAFDTFEAACREQGVSLSRPDTVVGSLATRLRDELMYVTDYLSSR